MHGMACIGSVVIPGFPRHVTQRWNMKGAVYDRTAAILSKQMQRGSSFFDSSAYLIVARNLPIALWRPIMKTVIASLLFAATVIASPAFAQNGSPHTSNGQGGAVYEGNQYLGSDPDPQVQFDLEREAASRHGGY
jgi:hypothetical protein